jgi:hypothetical protein
MEAATFFGQYDIALLLLEAGADHRVYMPRSNLRLVHLVAYEGDNNIRRSTWSPRQKADYEALARWLEQRGESIEEAREDGKRWRSWSTLNGEARRMMDAEVAARKAREAEAKKQAAEGGDK